jgi:glycosyltransferase involved in cell wall biosynthesis
MIPVLMITYNRLEYTKQALDALLSSRGVDVYIIDNCSTDGTTEWLKKHHSRYILMHYNSGITGAMNKFVAIVRAAAVWGKVDNDTIVEADWAEKLYDTMMINQIDIIQAKHHIIPATCSGGWEGFIRGMERPAKGVYLNHFVGGTGILWNRIATSCWPIPKTEWMLGGWRHFQRQHPELRKAFCDHTEVKLLDEHGYGDYPEYYTETKRLP